LLENKKKVYRLLQEIKMNSNQLKLIFEASPFGFAFCQIILDENEKPIDYRFLELNSAFEEISGLAIKSTLGKTFREAIPNIDELNFNWIEFYGNIALNGGSQSIEYYSPISKKWFQIYAYSSQKYYFVTMFIEITAKKKEAKLDSILKSQLNVLEKLSKQIPGVLYQYKMYPNGHSCFPLATENIRELCEVTPEEIQTDGSLLLNKIHPVDRQIAIEKALESKEKLEIWECEFRMLLSKNKEKWLKAIARPEALEDGSVLWHGYIYDITADKLEQLEKEKNKYLLELVISGTNDGIWDWNIETNEIFFSKRWKEIIGYEDHELKNEAQSFWLVVYEEDLPKLQYLMKKYLTGKIKKFNTEFRMKHKNGSIIWIHSKGSVVCNKEGKVIRIVGANRNITERKNYELALKEKEEKLREVQSVARLGSWELDLVKNKLSWSEQIYEIFGRNPREFEPSYESFFSCVHPEDRQKVEQAYLNHIQTKVEYNIVHRIVLPNQEVRYVHERCKTNFDANDKPLRSIGTVIDVTELKRKEEELKKKEKELRESLNQVELFKTMIENSGDCFYIANVDENFKIIYINEAGVKYFKAPKEEILTWRIPDFDPNFKEEELIKMVETLQEKKKIFIQTNHKLGDGTFVDAEISANYIHLPDSPRLVFGWFQDISKRLAFERELKQAKLEAEASNKAKSEFLANMSHEIRTPLNAIIGFTDLLLSTPLNEIQKEYCTSANTSGKALLDIVNDILDFSKIEAGKLELESTYVDIVKLLEEIIDIVKYHASQKNLELILNIQPNLPRQILVDPIRLKQVIINLLSNAIKFTDKGEIELKLSFLPLEQELGEYSFLIRDTGIGIAQEKQSKLFQAFYQVDSSTTRLHGGTGLGLAITKLLLEKMGSSIHLKSELGKGSEFFFTLKTKYAVNSLKVFEQLPIQKVLMLSANSTLLNALQVQFQNWKVEFFSFQSFNLDWNILEKKEINLLIIDRNIILENEFRDFQIKLQSLKYQFNIILLHNFLTDVNLCKECVELGVKFNLVKPIKPDELYETIRNIYKLESTTKKDSNSQELILREISPVILIVEDSIPNLKILKLRIKEFLPNAQILEAENGQVALEIIFSKKIDLVFMDIQMPVMDGLEATKKIREWETQKQTSKQIPILALTAGALKEEEKKALQAGMNEFLTKPIEKEIIFNTLKKYFLN